MSEIKVDKISPQSGTELTLGDASDDFLLPSGAEIKAQSGSTITIASGATLTNSGTATGFGGGKVLQVVSATKTDTFSHNSTTFTDITNITVTTGTLASTSSKILVTALLNGTNPTSYQSYFQLVRDSTPIAIADADGSRARASAGLYGANDDTLHPIVMQYLDSPSTTSATTYKVQCRVNAGSNSMYINRSYGDADNDNRCRGTSTITVMEIGA